MLYKIPRVVIGENTNWVGDEELLRSHGVEVVVLDDPECTALMARYIKEKPEVSRIAKRFFYCSRGDTLYAKKKCRTGMRISGNESSAVVYTIADHWIETGITYMHGQGDERHRRTIMALRSSQ